jgi:hypothetical protein
MGKGKRSPANLTIGGSEKNLKKKAVRCPISDFPVIIGV